ncbi:DUF2167 domain-containing protein [Mucilaginibacter pedocola]|uniref:DUF2167 domain-containing protein n=1 Tax=Mucilaginibacter pedocola TaxID=1792845 RepID=A0A1S9PAH2_9SPHI|nr:DUF2167 domain-containing protein [Mucilaginibacter pedocola]OOQ57984.1 hypothetical protein BC343_09955 [Mucilaginibacter pedocola]
MKKLYALIAFIGIFSTTTFAQETDSTAIKVAAAEKAFTYQHGAIKIGNGIATVNVPAGFKYLDSVQALRVLTDIWGNPKTENMTLGFLLPEKQGILATGGYVFNIQYEAIGYVKDDDAKDVDYDEMIANMKKEAKEESVERQKQGYPVIDIVGWAAKPYYDEDKHVLHWAKEIKFGTDSVNTLNYNVRVLGRKGVLVLNAIATMNEIKPVEADMPKMLTSVTFTDGNKYTNFDSGIDKVAAWTIGGLVAGKVLAKVGFFALALKFWKLIGIGLVAAFTAVKKFFTGKKGEEPVAPAEEEKEPVAAFEELNAENKPEEDKKDEEEKPLA